MAVECPREKGRFLKGHHYSPHSEFKSGSTPWSKGKHLSQDHKANLSKSLKGKKAWNKGKKGLQIAWNKGLTKKTDERMRAVSKSLQGREFSSQHRTRISESCKGRTAWNKGEKRPWLSELNRDPNFIKKRIRGLILHPSSPERKLMKIIEENNLPFKYVGNGSLIIGGLNPDFIDENSKKVIEVFGRVYHDPKSAFFKVPPIQTEFVRKKIYGKIGTNCLIIWEEELEEPELVVSKITNFLGVEHA